MMSGSEYLRSPAAVSKIAEFVSWRNHPLNAVVKLLTIILACRGVVIFVSVSQARGSSLSIRDRNK